MTFAPNLRKFALTVHVTCSVGWLGAVASFLALAVVGLTSQEGQRVSAAYLAMDMITGFIIVPLSIATLLSGVIQSLGTKWGLLRHYWVLAKLLITLVSILLLLLHRQPISYMAEVAAEGKLFSDSLTSLRIQLVVDASAALLALLITTILSIYKPRGITPYGWRKQQAQQRGAPRSNASY